jgi:hypothetical protein
MNIFEEAMKLGTERYDRERLLSITSDLIARFRLPNGQDMTKMRGACRHLADALDRCSGSTLQQRWNHFEKKIWPKWSAGPTISALDLGRSGRRTSTHGHPID